MSSIPSDEDFARAEKLMAERFVNLDKVSNNIKRRFSGICNFNRMYVLPQDDTSFKAYVFFENDRDVKEYEKTGLFQRIMDSVYEELERAGRGKREDITVTFEFDSDERVTRVLGGDYLTRLR